MTNLSLEEFTSVYHDNILFTNPKLPASYFRFKLFPSLFLLRRVKWIMDDDYMLDQIKLLDLTHKELREALYERGYYSQLQCHDDKKLIKCLHEHLQVSRKIRKLLH